jgi:hypothetical protein
MPNSHNQQGDGHIEPDTVAATLASDPEAVPEDCFVLIGIPAPSREDRFKLFLDIRMTRAVEGPREAIRGTKDIPEGQVPLGLRCVALWVAANTKLTHTHAGPGTRASSFVAVDVFVPIDVLLWPPASPFGDRPLSEPRDPRTIDGDCRPDPGSPTGFSMILRSPGKRSITVPCNPLED